MLKEQRTQSQSSGFASLLLNKTVNHYQLRLPPDTSRSFAPKLRSGCHGLSSNGDALSIDLFSISAKINPTSEHKRISDFRFWIFVLPRFCADHSPSLAK
jgi:hypothetical protein